MLTATFPRWPGDVEPAFVFDLCARLAEAGHHVDVLAPHAPGAQPKERMSGIGVRRFRYGPERWERLAYEGGIMANLKRNPLLYLLLPFYLIAQLVALTSCLRQMRYDSIHAHWLIPQGMLLAVASYFVSPRPLLICIAHGSDINALRGRFWSWLRRQIAARCDRVVAVSDALREQLSREGCSADRIAVIPMGTDLQRVFVPDGSLRASAELLFVGRLVSGKGVDTLLHAMPGILQRHPEVRLTIVGKGPARAPLETLARQLAVDAYVTFVGAVAHDMLPAHYRRAALLVVPSREEGFGLVAVEALGCGCPVAASDLPALRNVLLDGNGGAFFRPDDPSDLMETVFRLLEDAPYRTALAEAGRQSACQRYDWQAVARRYAEATLQ